MTVQLENKTQNSIRSAESYRVVLDDWAMTTVHVARYAKQEVEPRLVVFDQETALLEWCKQNEVANAMSAGFSLRSIQKPLGELCVNGVQQPTVPFLKPWSESRGSVAMSAAGEVTIAPRFMLSQEPETDLLQAGPLLVQNGQSVIRAGVDPDGFSAGSAQFDDDITIGRFPRAAIATDKDFIYSVACDGYGSGEAGLTFAEFADVLVEVGAQDALNLDGGSSATVINNGELVNRPRGGHHANYALFEQGRPIFSAILFDKA